MLCFPNCGNDVILWAHSYELCSTFHLLKYVIGASAEYIQLDYTARNKFEIIQVRCAHCLWILYVLHWMVENGNFGLDLNSNLPSKNRKFCLTFHFDFRLTIPIFSRFSMECSSKGEKVAFAQPKNFYKFFITFNWLTQFKFLLQLLIISIFPLNFNLSAVVCFHFSIASIFIKNHCSINSSDESKSTASLNCNEFLSLRCLHC